MPKYDLCVLRGLACDSNIFPHIQYVYFNHLILKSWRCWTSREGYRLTGRNTPYDRRLGSTYARCNGSILAVSKTCKSAWKRWKRICSELLMWFNGAKKKTWAFKQHLKPRSFKVKTIVLSGWQMFSIKHPGRSSGYLFVEAFGINEWLNSWFFHPSTRCLYKLDSSLVVELPIVASYAACIIFPRNVGENQLKPPRYNFWNQISSIINHRLAETWRLLTSWAIGSLHMCCILELLSGGGFHISSVSARVVSRNRTIKRWSCCWSLASW